MGFNITVNYENVFGKGVEEAGRYNVKIVNARTDRSRKNNEYVSIDYEVLDGTFKGGQIRYQNLTWDESDIPMSEKRFNTLLVAIGVQDGVKIDSIETLAKSLIGKTLTIDVDWDEPNSKSKVYLAVKGYHPLFSELSAPNGVKRPQTNVVPMQAVTPNAPINPAAPMPTDDDLPF